MVYAFRRTSPSPYKFMAGTIDFDTQEVNGEGTNDKVTGYEVTITDSTKHWADVIGKTMNLQLTDNQLENHTFASRQELHRFIIKDIFKVSN